MNELMSIIQERRSVRKFKAEQVSREHLDFILLAGTYAPNAGGRQSAIIVACQNAAINDELGRINLEIYRKMQGQANFNNAFYNAPTVVTLFAPEDWYNFTVDCCLAAENMALAAHSVGVGSCIIARATETFSTERGKALQREWRIDETYEAKIHLILGYPDGTAAPAKPRDGDRIIVIE